MTEAKIVSSIVNYITSFRGVTGNPIPMMQVADEVDTLRLRYVKELDDAGQLEKPYLMFGQDIRSVAVQRLDDKSSFIQLPVMYITRKGIPAISYIGGTDMKSPYRIMTGSQHMHSKHDHLMGNNPPIASYEGNGRWSIYNTRADKITILSGIFYSPRSLGSYGYDSGFDNEGGYSATDYPAPQGIVDQIIGKTQESYLRTMYRVPSQANTQSDNPVNAK